MNLSTTHIHLQHEPLSVQQEKNSEIKYIWSSAGLLIFNWDILAFEVAIIYFYKIIT